MTLDYQRPPVRVALMGLGRAMLLEHYQIFKNHPSLFKIVAACDVSKDRRDIIAKDFPNCKMFRQFSDMLDEREIDLVVIATGSIDHARHAMRSLKRGFWTLIESPVALNPDEAQMLRGQAKKAKDRLLVVQRGLFEPDFLLAKQEMTDVRLGPIYDIRIRREDYIRRDDWQTVKRLGGGAAYYIMPDLMAQTLKLLPTPPIQMWSELKRIASVGDAEDYAHVNLRTRTSLTADIEYNGGVIEPLRTYSFVLRGENGEFRVRPGESTGTLTLIDPAFKFPRRRSSVRQPMLKDLHEKVPTVEIPVSLPKDTLYGPSTFWRSVYNTVRIATPFPMTLEESFDAAKFSYLMKKTSPFGISS